MIVNSFSSPAFVRDVESRSDVKACEGIQHSDRKICIPLVTKLQEINLKCKVVAFTGIVRFATDTKDSRFIGRGSLERSAPGFLSTV